MSEAYFREGRRVSLPDVLWAGVAIIVTVVLAAAADVIRRRGGR